MPLLSLQLGELSIALALENDRFRQQMAQTKRELEGLPPVAQREVRKITRTFDAEGRKAGGTLSKGINQGLIRNSPLIAAGISGALAAGAPVALAGAAVLFGGIGAVAAAQSDSVRQAWLGTWQEISHGTQAAASSLVPVFEKMAGQIGASFQRMRPLLEDAFEAAGPQIDDFTDSLTQAAENALPGLVRAVQAAGPVIDGLGNFLEDVGTGLSDFFDAMSSHAPAAGSAFDALGDIIGNLLPILGELLGQGAELAAIVLPPLASALGVVADAARALGPLMPAVAAGILALKVAQMATGWVGTLAGKFTELSKNGGLAQGAMSRIGSAITPVNVVTGALAIGTGLLGAAFAKSEQQAADWAQALNEGGEAAAGARAEIDAFFDTYIDNKGEIDSFAVFLGTLSGDLAMNGHAAAEAQDKNDDYIASLSDLEGAERDVRIAQEALGTAIKDHGPKSLQAAEASDALARAEAEAARQAAIEEREIRGVTDAMIEQLDHARSLVDMEFAYEDALKGVSQLTQAYADAVKEHGANSQQAADALDQLERGYRDAGQAASDLATSKLPASMDDQQKAIIGAREELGYYHGLLEQGIDLPPELDQHVAYLEAVVAQAPAARLSQEQLASAVEDLGFAVERVPDSKSIVIDAPTDELTQKLDDLGFKVEHMEDGSIRVTPETAEAEAALLGLDQSLVGLDTKETQVDVKYNSDVEDGVSTDLAQLFLIDTLFPNVDTGYESEVPAGTSNDFNLLDILGGQKPTPIVGLDDKPFSGIHGHVMGLVQSLAGQKPTPVADMADGPFTGIHSRVMDRIREVARQNPTPTVTGIDQASGVIGSIISGLGQIRDKTVTVTTVQRFIGASASGSVPLRAAGGPIVGPGTGTSDDVPLMGSNGEHMLTAREVNAAGGHGAIFALRRALLAGRTGLAGGGPVGERAPSALAAAPAGRTTHITVEARTNDERRIAAAISHKIRDDEFLAGVS